MMKLDLSLPKVGRGFIFGLVSMDKPNPLPKIVAIIGVFSSLAWLLAYGVGDYTLSLLKGAGITLALALIALLLATVLGLFGAWAKVAGGPISRTIANIYTVIIRGVPDLVLILLIYYGGQRLVNLLMGAAGFEQIDVSPFLAGLFAIGFIYGAYLTETFRGAWLSVPRGQIDAGKALGLPPFLSFRKILMPQLVRSVLTGYANVWQVLIKSTAVVSVIGLNDLVGLADKIGKSTREPFVFLVVVMLFYLVMTIVSESGFKWLERRGDRWAT